MRVVITGSRGFMGWHLVRRLRAEGAEILGLSTRLSQPQPQHANGCRIHTYREDDVATLLPDDWKEGPFTLVDLAWITTRPPGYAAHAEQLVRLGWLLDQLTARGMQGVIGIGSAEEYGQAGGFLAEDDQPEGVISPYGWSKRAACEIVQGWARSSGLPCLWLRPFLVYGPRQQGNMLLPYAVRQARAGVPALFSDGMQQRDLIDVRDLVELMVRALRTPAPGFQVVNAGIGTPVRICDVLLFLGERLGVSHLFRLGEFPRRPGEPDLQVAKITKAHALFGWSPQIAWRDGLGYLVEQLRTESSPGRITVSGEETVGRETRVRNGASPQRSGGPGGDPVRGDAQGRNGANLPSGVIILGGGLAGLGCALHCPGARIFEADSSPGGHARSQPLGGAWFDQGAHISHSRDADFVQRICQAAGDVVTISPSIVRNRWRGRWLTYPVQNHLVELPLDGRVRALSDLVEAHGAPTDGAPQNYRAWCLRQYGRYLTETFYDVFTAKYWRSRAEDLATDWLGGRLLPSMLPRIIQGTFGVSGESQAVFSSFRYPARGGFFRFFESMYSDLPIKLGERATLVDVRRQTVAFASGRLEHYDFLATSVPLPDLVSMIKDVPAEVAQAAALLRATQLLCVNLIVGLPRLTDCHWFYVYDHEIEPARVSIPSNLSPQMLPPDRTAIQAEVFRRQDEPMDASSLVERTVAQLGGILGFSHSDVLHLNHQHLRRAYVISDHQRGPAVAAISAWLEEHNIYPMGLFGRWKYVWSDEAFRQGRQTAEAIAQRCGAATERRQSA